MSTLSPTQPLAARPAVTGRIAAFIVLLVIVVAALGALRKDATQGFDEVAHASYVAHIQQTGNPWPAFDDLRMLDPEHFRFTGEPNYLNHPPLYYALLAALGPRLEGHPGAILVHRFINIGIAALGIAALLLIGFYARLPAPLFYAYAVPLACVPVLAPLSGAINNDNLAFAGGALTMLGTWQLLATGRASWLWLALAGMIIAAWAKLTGLMLSGGLLAGVLLWLVWRRRFQAWWSAPVVLSTLLAALPYIILIIQYGSPTPNTHGQVAMLEAGAHATGWDHAPRMSPLAYAAYFLGTFVLEWMPSLTPRYALNYAALVIPVTAAVCALAGVALSLRRIVRNRETPLDVVVVAGALAFAATFVIHVAFSYQRHLVFGWMMDAYPRYYLPLLAIVPLAGLSLLSAVERPRARHILIGFFVVGPILFRLLAAPLG